MPEAPEITAVELRRVLAGDAPPLLIDVRESYERMRSRIEPSEHIPMARVAMEMPRSVPDLKRDVVLYCSKGQRSAWACHELKRLGYTRVRSLAGGLDAWEESTGHRVADATAPEFLPRYARQVQLPEVGPEGQRRLLKARVLLVGAGGLGSPAAYYLAAAGVGTLGLVDFDVVDESNLQRQILYRTADVGLPKVQAARRELLALNPHVQVLPIQERLTSENALRIVGDFDLVLDGADNFAARYLVNDVCVLLGKPNVHGAIHQFEGQVSVFCQPDGPCYRCLFPEPPPAGWVPSCAEAGVMGFLPGLVGTLQAAETIKWILGQGELLSGRLLRLDALSMTFETFAVSRRVDCAYCGDGASFPGLVDYEDHCGPA
jgi:molybdopterin/thiamine biosynthesis adenylyltransferase/rhodanese-related sulfurtransferase